MRLAITILISKIIKLILNIFNKRGGSLPGKIALKIYPNLLKSFKLPQICILVSGTNGKTTTTNMIYKALSLKYHTIGNIQGDNLIAGISTLLLLNSSIVGKIKAEAVVIEVDEISLPNMVANLNISHIVVGNFFRDQLDRAGEMETIIRKFEKALENYHNNLILNADDPNVFRLGYKKKNVYYYKTSKYYQSSTTTNEANEGKFCFICNKPLTYDYYQYSHIGNFRCNSCNFDNYSSFIQANDICRDAQTFYVDHKKFHNPYDTIYSLYNCLAVISIAKLLDINYDEVNNMFKTFKMNDGRMEEFNINRPVLLNLVKNPTGTNEVLKYIIKDKSKKDLWIILNDNGQDGYDISWIYDVKFEMLKGQVDNIICSGKRGYEIALCLKYNDLNNIKVYTNEEKALSKFSTLNNKGYVLATYTALQPVRKLLKGYR